MLILLIGVATAFNIIILMIKFKAERYIDGLLDLALLIILAKMAGDTITGLATAMVASMVISLYLLAFPPKFAD